MATNSQSAGDTVKINRSFASAKMFELSTARTLPSEMSYNASSAVCDSVDRELFSTTMSMSSFGAENFNEVGSGIDAMEEECAS